MSDDSDETLDFLELFHFTVCLIGEDIKFIDMFKGPLVKLLKPRVSRFMASMPNGTCNNPTFIHGTDYNRLLGQITNQVHQIIDAVRRAKLWFPQGGGPSVGDPVDRIAKVLLSPNHGLAELQILRGINVDKLSYQPELVLYYSALFKSTLSTERFVRLFGYALLRAAPFLYDFRHFFSVLQEALKIWEHQTVTFEFTASLVIVLNSLCDVIHQILEDEVRDLLFGLLESLPKSRNFSLLMVFDPTLKWVTKALPIESLKRVLDTSMDLLAQGFHAHICLITRAISKGIFGFDMVVPALRIALPSINEWSKSTKHEARTLMTTLLAKLP
jgi:hypothetical protein